MIHVKKLEHLKAYWNHKANWKKWGLYHLGNDARRLQRRRQYLVLLSSRSCPKQSISLGEKVIPLKVRPLVGLMPLSAVETLDHNLADRLLIFNWRLNWFLDNQICSKR